MGLGHLCFQRQLFRVGGYLSDPRLAAAVVDRMTFRALIIETGTDSYRLRAARGAKARGAKGVETEATGLTARGEGSDMAVISGPTGRWELVVPRTRSPTDAPTPQGRGISSTRSLTALSSPTATTKPCNWSTT